jgi:sugar lactone lactonase YvrE
LWLTTAGVVYIADYNNHRIRKVFSNIISTVAGSGCTNGCTGTLSGDGIPATSATLYHPRGVYMDTNGRLFIADTENCRIRWVDTNNIITTFAGTSPCGFNGDNIPALSANLNYPTDVKGDSAGNIYIADNTGCIIRLIDANRIIGTLFGSNGICGFSSGKSSRTSSIGTPSGIWLDSQSTVYFSDFKSIHRGILISSPTSRS